MLITRIELENIKSYRHFIGDFRRGTTAIGGATGAGKTTLVEAIGYALFDYIPYNQNQFVREGEKYGNVVVHFIGNDDRAYQVERRCGAGSRWFVYDCEADYRIEQRTDVLDKLHELFGIDRERPLETLFRDALGVPQGTFTAIFLETASKRKQTFDTLLQIEDYKTAADYLLEAQKQYKEQMQTQQSEIQRLEFETRDLENWRALLKEMRQRDQEQKEQNVLCTHQLAQFKERYEVLKQRRDHLKQCQMHYEQSRTTHEAAQQLLQGRQQELSDARAAQQAVEDSRGDYQRYRQADEALKHLRQDERQRNSLREQQGNLNTILATIRAHIVNLQGRLDEVAAARQRVVELSPLVEQQYELDKQRDELARQVTRYEELVKEGKRLVQQRADHLQQQEVFQKRIVEIEPLQPLAALLHKRVETLAQLQARVNERISKRQQFEEKRKQLQEKHDEREQTAGQLRKAENAIAQIEEHRQEAETLPSLQEQFEQLSAQRHQLEGTITGYKKSRQQSLGGQCPLLHETCLNIKQKGLASLESYFDGELAKEHTYLEHIDKQSLEVNGQITSVKKYADALNNLGQYVERRNSQAERLKRLNTDITRLEREVTSLGEDLEALKLVEQEIVKAKAEREESEQADRQVRELEGLRKQVQQLQAQAQKCQADLNERRQQADELRGSGDQLVRVEQELQVLNDPRSRSKAQQEIIRQEPAYQQQMQAEEQKRQKSEGQLHSLEAELKVYASLDIRIGEQEAIRQQSEPRYQMYLQNEQAARRLPERELAFQLALRKAEQAQQALLSAQQAHRDAVAAFNAEELAYLAEEIERLQEKLAGLAEAMRNLQIDINELERNISQAEALLIELEAAQQEKHTLEELHSTMEHFRRLIKEAAPHVLKAMLADISAEANRIFGEIMGDRSGQLSWQNDYEIVLRRQGINRIFAQLSGGEQMSAALSVRLALLKKLSTLNIAFFDEPTQNMDELRRMNLAEQIRRVRGFDQLLVISHDDTFEQGLDSLIRLRKVDGETRHMTEDERVEVERERVAYP